MSGAVQYAEPMEDGVSVFLILDDPCPACGFPDLYRVAGPEGDKDRPCPQCGGDR